MYGLLLSASEVKTLADAGLVFFVGLGIVFSVLTLLIGIVYAYVAINRVTAKAVLSGRKSKKKGESDNTNDEITVQNNETTNVLSDEEVVAVISSVISLYYTDENGVTAPFRVKSFTKIK